MKHGNHTFLHCPVRSFCHSILLRSISDRMLPVYALINAECLKLGGHVLPTLVIPQSAQFRSSEVLCPDLVLLESSKCLRFLLEQINSLEVRVIIDKCKCDPIAIPLMCRHLDRAMDISLWTSWSGFEALEVEIGKGSACIFPALQAPHTGSGLADESSLNPFTRLPAKSFLMPERWWWQRRQCQRSQSNGRVVVEDSEADSSTGMVSPTRKAAEEAPVFAWKTVLPLLMKSRVFPLMETVKWRCSVRKRTEKRLLQRAGT